MNGQDIGNKGIPHLTPTSLVGERFGKDSFRGIKTALVGFCPRPAALDKYQPQASEEQYFVHMPPPSVEICQWQGTAFLSLSHVYGGPVASAAIEELAFYGIISVLAYGLAGGLGTKGLRMGDLYLVEQALAMDGTTPHYTDERVILSDRRLNSMILEMAAKKGLPKMIRVQAMTGDAIYREYDHELELAKAQGCDIVNCDSAHLFAVSRAVGIRSTQCGVISDASMGDGQKWVSNLSVMLSAQKDGSLDPITRVGKLVEFLAEAVLPEL